MMQHNHTADMTRLKWVLITCGNLRHLHDSEQDRNIHHHLSLLDNLFSPVFLFMPRKAQVTHRDTHRIDSTNSSAHQYKRVWSAMSNFPQETIPVFNGKCTYQTHNAWSVLQPKQTRTVR
eukprot:6456032-Amphidinium_carterae.2